MGYLVKFICAAGVVLSPAAAQASGFALREYSAAGQGNAFAGATASAEDITFMAFNPAGLTLHPGEHASAGATAILPTATFSKTRATTVLGGTIGGGTGGDGFGKAALAPSVFYSRQMSENVFAGASLTVPFGLATNYDPDWVGRYHSIKSDIRTYNFNPVIAFKATPQLSLGGGVQVAYTRGVLSNAVDFGTLDIANFSNANGGVATQNDGLATSEGDALSVGYNFGLLWQFRPDTRVGFAYRSMLHSRLEGSASFNNSTVGNAISGSSGAFVKTGNKAELNLPESASLGIHHEVSPRLAVMAEAAWTAWSRVKELRVDFDNSAQSDNVTRSNWHNTMFLAVGATYKANDKWLLRAGVAYDESPIPNATRTPRVPDEDRTWISIGARYQVASGATLDFGYTHIFFKDASLSLTTADTNNNLRGNLSGSYTVSADILAVHYNQNF